MRENLKNEKSKELREKIITQDEQNNSSILRLHKEAIKVERERSIKHVLTHFMDIGILNSKEFEKYFNIFLHDLEIH